MIKLPKLFRQDDSGPLSTVTLPLLPLRDIVVFPHMVVPLFVGRKKSVNALADAMNKDKNVFLATQLKAGVDNPGEKDISRVGTIGTVLQLLRLPDGTVKALVEGKTRARITDFREEDDFFKVELAPVDELPLADTEAEALIRAITEAFTEYAKSTRLYPRRSSPPSRTSPIRRSWRTPWRPTLPSRSPTSSACWRPSPSASASPPCSS
jgi:ATP-dependent Lon protease